MPVLQIKAEAFYQAKKAAAAQKGLAERKASGELKAVNATLEVCTTAAPKKYWQRRVSWTLFACKKSKPPGVAQYACISRMPESLTVIAYLFVTSHNRASATA